MKRKLIVEVTIETDAFPENREDPKWETDSFVASYMDYILYNHTIKEHGYPWQILEVSEHVQ